ncbi:hypothetical protein M0804_003543 [Polistes exclamans]|nr:hypothetical protein M0804_003543 [Polistes exclamans]
MPEQIGNWYSVGCPFDGQTDLRRSTLGKRTAKCVPFHGVRIEPQFSITNAQGRSLAALSQHMRSAGSIWATMDPNP